MSARNTSDHSDSSSDFDYFITSDLPIEHVYNMLKLQNMSEKEIDAVVDKVKEARDNIRKVVGKFLRKLNTTYGHLDLPDIIKKGMKHAEKYGLTEAQKKVFINHVMKGDVHNYYSYTNEIKYSPMAKFLGFDTVYGQMIRLLPKDHSKLNDLHMLYDETKHIHADVKTQLFNYRDCAPEAITGQYDRNKHNVSVSIHPVFAALFLPKVNYLEKRMLYTNIARLVLTRAQAYLKTGNFHHQTNLAPGELDADFETAYDIAHDPNALEYFKDDTPIENIIKRFRCQIELYKTVLNLRQGRYYSTGYNEDDGITGLLRTLNSYEWTFFDSPDLYHVQDEGTVLRKLLAVFSCRPTYTQLSDFSLRYGLSYSNVNALSRTVFVNIPVINIKLPFDFSEERRHSIALSKALTQTDFFIEHKSIVPKNKTIIFSNQIAFFYANRRYPSVNFADADCNMRYVSLPVSFVNQTTINKTSVIYDDRLRIGRDWFKLRSVVVLQRPSISGIEVAVGSSALIQIDSESTAQNYETLYLHYNPSAASIKHHTPDDPDGTVYQSNAPITYVDEISTEPHTIGFRTDAQERGTVFFYVKD